jgi:hypothetical protein
MTPAERLERLSIPEPNSGCRIWLGRLEPNGYGKVHYEGRTRWAHDVAYELANGPIPHGMEPHHKCRVRCCIEPNHLEALTPVAHAREHPQSRAQRKFICDRCGDPIELLKTSRNGRPFRGCRSCRAKVSAAYWKTWSAGRKR